MATIKARMDESVFSVSIGEVQIVAKGQGTGGDSAERAHAVMRRGEYSIYVHLHGGRGEGRHTTCDLTVDYVKLNADYRS